MGSLFHIIMIRSVKIEVTRNGCTMIGVVFLAFVARELLFEKDTNARMLKLSLNWINKGFDEK